MRNRELTTREVTLPGTATSIYLPIVYHGGYHVILCDGLGRHWIDASNGYFNVSGRCSDWAGGCPAEQERPKQRRKE